MQENQPQAPMANSLQTTVTVDSRPKANSFLIILLSILLLISCLIASFFAYQTQKLASELRIKNEELRITPTPTQIASTEPTTDPTSNWKIYKNEQYKFEFKYPDKYLLVLTNMPGNTETDSQNHIGASVFDTKYLDYEDRIVDVQYVDLIVPPIGKISIDTIVGNLNAKKYIFVGGDASIKFDIYQIKLASGGIEIMTNKQNQEQADQIISTLKFTN